MLSPLTLLLAPAMNRLYLFDQSDFGAKRGWYVSFENEGPEGTPLPVGTLRLILAVGDGTQWRFADYKGPFDMSQGHALSVRIGGGKGTMSVDDREVARIEGNLAPQAGPVAVGRAPDWAIAPAAYALSQTEYRVAEGGRTAQGVFPAASLALFERPLERRADLPAATTVEANTGFAVFPKRPPTANLIDAYGQVVHFEGPSPVRSDADLRAAVADEAKRGWARDPGLDVYGGLKTAPWREKPTGFFRVVKREGRWTMVSPQGNPLFYTGLCTAPAPKWDMTPVTGREDLFAAVPPKGELWNRGVWGDDADYFTPIGWSLSRKYGTDWQTKVRASTKARLAGWRFSGMGKWAEPIAGVPRVVDLSADWPKLGRHLDPFDPAACAKARESLERQLKDVEGDPWVVGNSIGNEYDEIVTRDEIAGLPDSPAKEALKGLDVEAARQKYARAYYKFLYDTVKSIDPHHLYFGFWVSVGWWQDETDWDLAATGCDVVGYDRYSDLYAGMAEREKRTGKPTLLGEFSHPAWYGGTRGYGRYNVSTETDADSGDKYAETVMGAAKDPYCVGALWFQYRDEPITGRGPGKGRLAAQGEHYAFGFVDVNDRPKWDLVTRARAANMKATGWKLGR